MKNNHTTTENTAAVVTPKNGYKVTPETAALLDCLRETSELYTHILQALEPLHGIINGTDTTDEAAAPYLIHVNAITDLLHEELTGRICDSLSDVANSHNPDEIKL